MKDYNEDFPRHSKVVEKGRKNQKFKKIIKEYSDLEYQNDELDDEILELNKNNKRRNK